MGHEPQFVPCFLLKGTGAVGRWGPSLYLLFLHLTHGKLSAFKLSRELFGLSLTFQLVTKLGLKLLALRIFKLRKHLPIFIWDEILDLSIPIHNKLQGH